MTVAEPIAASFTPLEGVTIVTPLGIRFWDPARQAPVTDGLTVTARPLGAPRRAAVRAFRTISGVYAFQGLPGLRRVEHPDAAAGALSSPPAATRFVVEVEDTGRRFLPIAVGVDVPYRGIYPTATVSSPVGQRPPGFYLFSAPTRPAAAALAVVRAHLVEAPAGPAARPAAHAVLEVAAPGQEPALGLADERGVVAVFLAYPTFTGAPGVASPLSPPGTAEQRWTVRIRVRYAPATLTVPPGSRLPDLRGILTQPPGRIQPSLLTQPVDELAADLVFGQDLVLRTDAGPTLSIGPATSPL
jgi:hypothetical protein